MAYFLDIVIPDNAVFLFFSKAEQFGLFGTMTPVKGYVNKKTGKPVAPYTGLRHRALKKPDHPLSGNLFGHAADEVASSHIQPEPVKVKKPRKLSPEKLDAFKAKIAQIVAHAKVDAQHAPKQGEVYKKLYLAQLEAIKGIPADLLDEAKQNVEGLFKPKTLTAEPPQGNGNGNGGGKGNGGSGGNDGGGSDEPPRRFKVTAERKGKEVKFTVEDAFFDWLQVKPYAIWADVDRLHLKHPDHFASAEAVQQHIQDVLAGAEIAMPATHVEYTLLVALRDHEDHQAATIEFVLRGGKYRVRNAQKMPQTQLDVKLDRAGVEARLRRGKRNPTVPPRNPTTPGISAGSPVPPSDGPPTKPKLNLPPPAPEGKAAPPQDPNAFITSPSGTIDFGRIAGDVATAIKQPEGPIRLQAGFHDDATGRGFGKVHIDRDLRATELAQNGYSSTEALIEDVAQHFTAIYEGKNNSFILVKENGKAKIAFVSVKQDENGVFYSVGSGLISRTDYLKRNPGCGKGRSPISRSPLALSQANSRDQYPLYPRRPRKARPPRRTNKAPSARSSGNFAMTRLELLPT